ncbi:TonB-dependent receptor plug domain-containing protein [Myroides pelagicus]|uniref:TonB-dependent receptor plug domain-containing protein n=1 Tax=Myroides pelagicus TaxID=270914 RepID=UPI002DBC1672|nr:TonB-dependent receptor plug domain-containing protein [Myroides pelagicus]MEC4114731.1 TonB-dependent receptor plug domain-containing protein [Myroides pelagicus]
MFNTISKLSLLTFFILLFSVISVKAQNKKNTLLIIDPLGKPISDVYVQVISGEYTYTDLTDNKGSAKFGKVENIFTVITSHLGYGVEQKQFTVNNKAIYKLELIPVTTALQDIVVTAKEGKGLSSSSIINRKAMAHLQPSSFSDLMELLPGGKASEPNLTSTNRVLIREFGKGGGQYNTGSLGTQFMIDGAILNTNADFQVSVDRNGPTHNTTNIGVDMRTIATNDIESVEIVRGIPSAAYGDLTSGLVKITRKSGFKSLEARLKTDGFSKLFYLSRGFAVSATWDINVNVDYLNAKSDPRDITQLYNRYGVSIRSKKIYSVGLSDLSWQTNLDYKASIDKNVVDPDVGYEKIDRYKNQKHVFYLTNKLEQRFFGNSFIDKLSLQTNIRQAVENLKQRKLVQFSGPTSISVATETGVNDGYYPKTTFVSNFRTEGRPLDIQAQLKGEGDFTTASIKHNIEFGVDYRYSKNNGKGQIYDVAQPPSDNMTTRPRSFNDIPAHQTLALFLGDRMEYAIQKHKLSLYAGMRLSKMLDVSQEYSIANKIYAEPRVNLQWNFPKVIIGNGELISGVTLGYGELYKQPTLGMLYPNLQYLDFTQLNFGHINPDVRRVNYMTYVVDITNKQLLAAKNVKKEIRLDLGYKGHSLFVTYFDEQMPSGFRSVSNYNSYVYKLYDTSGLDIANMTAPPVLAELPYEDKAVLMSRSQQNNGSETYKRGIEFGYYSPRIKALQTRFTFMGAWFRTTYKNSQPIQEKPNVSLAGKGYEYIGIYNNDTGFEKSGMNYNLVVDTYLSSIDMNISASVQGTWFLREYRAFKHDAPIAYFGLDGVIHDYTDMDRTDTYKQWLIRPVSVTDNMEERLPFDVQVNLKVTKKIFKSLGVSLFVNKLFDYYQPYYFNNKKVERPSSTNPYFGMELTYNF